MRQFFRGKRTTLIPVLVVISMIIGLGSFVTAAYFGTARSTANCKEVEKLKGVLRANIQDSITQIKTIKLPGFSPKARTESIKHQTVALHKLDPEPCPREN